MKRSLLLLCVILLIPMLCAPVSASGYGEAYDELPSDAFREAYRILEEGIAGMAPVITLPEKLQIHFDELLDIARSVCLDHPEYFWFLESWFYEFGTNDNKFIVTTITPTYYLDHERVSAGSQLLADAMIEFHSKVDEIITGIPVNCTSEYEIALYLHDYLADHVTYTLEGDHDSAYAALIHGKAACYGYSKAYQYLLNRAGIRSRIIVGDAVTSDGTMGAHAWNQVWIDDQCYYTDVTWDDLEFGTTHKYFMMSLNELSKDHQADDLFNLGECDHSLDYYQLCAGNGVVSISENSFGRAVAEYFRLDSFSEEQGAVFVCDARFECDMVGWVQKHASDLLAGLKLSYNTEFSYYYFGDVYYLILSDPDYRLVKQRTTDMTLNLTEATLIGQGAQAQIDVTIQPYFAGIRQSTFVSDNEAVAVVDEFGMVTAVAPGTATITVTSYDEEISRKCVITVEAGADHIHDLRLIPAADPTCKLDGNDPYYLCTGCFHRFADENAIQELTDVAEYTQKPTGHVDLIWGVKDHSHYRMCVCGEFIPQTTASHTDSDQDGLCDVCAGTMPKKSEPAQEPEEEDAPNWIWIAFAGGVVAVAAAAVVIKRKFCY